MHLQCLASGWVSIPWLPGTSPQSSLKITSKDGKSRRSTSTKQVLIICRGSPFQGPISTRAFHGRSSSNPDYQPPPFRKATSQWSPPLSPTTGTTTTFPQVRHTSLPATLTPPRSPRQEPAVVSSVTLSPVSLEEHTSLASRLYAASCSGDISQISLLISLGASVNTATKIIGLYEAFKPAKHGHLSPLAGAATHGQIEAVKFLIAHGADVNPHVNHSSSSPLHQACHSNDIEMVRFLLSADAQVNVQNCYKTTPLMYAVKYGSPALVALVLSYYPRLEVPSFMGMTAAHWAIFNGRPEALVSLLRAGANPDAIMADGSTPLHCAAMNGTEEMASSLIAYGADIALRDGQDRTVMEVALSNNRDGVVAILRAAEMQTLGRRR